MEVDIIIAIGIAVVVLFFIAQLSRIIRTNVMHRTLRKGIEMGHPLNPDIVDQLERAPEPGTADQRIGFVLVAIALALFLAAAMNPGQDNWRQLVTVGLFPLLVGAALLLRLRLAARDRAEP